MLPFSIFFKRMSKMKLATKLRVNLVSWWSFGASSRSMLLLSHAAVLGTRGVALTPPLGWRSFNAFWGIIDQVKMEGTMDAMTNKSRSVAGQPTSLLELGYNHIGLDGGWNYCFPENKSFHTKEGEPVWCDWAKGRPCQGNVSFPDPQAMVDKERRLGLAPGWCAPPLPLLPPCSRLLTPSTCGQVPEQLRVQRAPVRGKDGQHYHGGLRQGPDLDGLGGPQARLVLAVQQPHLVGCTPQRDGQRDPHRERTALSQ